MKAAKNEKRRPFTFLILSLALILWPGIANCLQFDINTASKKDLQNLPFIGEGRAEAIIEYRLENGPLKNLEELLVIQGIGETSLQAISPYLTVDGKKNSSPVTGLEVKRRINLKSGAIMILPDDKYYEVLLNFIQEAERTIDIAMYLFKITDSPKNQARLLLKELIKARKRGVMVNLILEQSDYNDKLNLENHRVAGLLKKNRINVTFDGPNTTSHTKLIVIDHRFTFLGSHNFTHSALSYNHEMSVLVDNQNLAEEMLDHIDMIELSR